MITPMYDFSHDEVTLYESECKIIKDNVSYQGMAKINFIFLPKPQIVIDAKFKDSVVSEFEDDEIDFFIGEKKVDIFIVSSPLDPYTTSSELNCVSRDSDIPLIVDVKKTRQVIFHIFNFYHFKDYNKKIPYKDSGGYRVSEETFETQDYTITIQSLKETNKNIEIIKKKGISRLTQVAKVEKKDKGFISIEEYKKLQELLTYFFSFSKGSWINPSCAIGIDDNDEKKWYLLNPPKSEWKSLESWFKPTYGQLGMSTMKKLFSLFAKLWEVESWRETLWEVIYWFINANDGSRGVDAGLILAQTALERLSFEYAVNDKKLLSSKGFKDIRASDKFKLLFSSLNIPLEIPSELKTLTKEAKSKSHNWLDAPHALTEVRNSLVHAEHKKHGKFGVALYSEAHTLSLWYLEISILAICKFDDVYANRVKNGQIENVPYIKVQS